MKRLTVEELQKLQAVWDSNVNERWNHETAISLGCIARPVLPALLAMASRLVELESVFEFVRLYYSIREPVDVYYCKSADRFLRLPAAMQANRDAHPDLPGDVCWTSPTQKPNDGGRDG